MTDKISKQTIMSDIELERHQRQQARRHWLALAILILGLPIPAAAMLVITGMCSLWIVGGIDLVISEWQSKNTTHQHDAIFYISGVVAIATYFADYLLWKRFFSKSGYLDEATWNKLQAGQFPGNFDRLRKPIGYGIYIPIWWMITYVMYSKYGLIGAVLPFFVILLLVSKAWKEWRG